MKNFIIFLLLVLCVLFYINRGRDIDYIEKIKNFPEEIRLFIKNIQDPEKREMLSKEFSKQVRRVESTLGDIQFGGDKEALVEEKYMSLELLSGVVVDGRLVRRTGTGDFILKLPGSIVTVAKEEVKEVRNIEGEEADVLRELIAKAEVVEEETKEIITPRKELTAALGLTHRWESDIPTALTKAKQQNKLVMVEFSTTWCGWCKKLDKETMRNNNVQKVLNKYFISVRIDGDKNKDLVRKYRVQGYPNIVFLDKNGRLIVQQPGFLPPERFVELLYVIVEKFKGQVG
ncbi:thioredoxin family protein [Candidatus Omnitrophota bacterium]